MKRLVLCLPTNVAILLVLSIAMRVLGLEPYLTETGLNLTSLLVMAAVMGFGGLFIWRAISKWMAKKSRGVRVIETPSNSTEFWLVDTIRKYAADAGIGMPEVGVYDGPDVNAFATGITRHKALVAGSGGPPPSPRWCWASGPGSSSCGSRASESSAPTAAAPAWPAAPT